MEGMSTTAMCGLNDAGLSNFDLDRNACALYKAHKKMFAR
jgi:hypothetical protein